MNRQYSFSLPHAEKMTAEDFMVSASNRDAAAWTLELAPWKWPHHCVIVHGPLGCGKTHLLSAWAERNGARKAAPGEDIVPAVLEKSCRAAAIDDADSVSGKAEMEEWLKHLYDAAETSGARLLLAASAPPAAWGLGLQDIVSRLKSCPSIEIGEPDDVLMRGLLVKLFSDRQLLVDADVIEYLTARIERTGTAARQAVEELDVKALELGRKITVPFAGEVLFSRQSRTD